MIEQPAEIRRIVYLGTPAIAVSPLLALHDAGYEIPLVISRPDAKRGRGGRLTPSPVKAAATELGIPVSHNVADTLHVGGDLGVVVAYGRLIGTDVLDRLAMVNMHFSLLPRWRGAAPVERALLAGDKVTGVCLMVLAEELDVGDVYRRVEVPISSDVTLDELRAELVGTGTELLLDALSSGFGEAIPQSGEVTWARKISAHELELDWNGTAEEVNRTIRVGNAWTLAAGRRLKVWRAVVIDRTDLEPGRIDGHVVGTGVGAIELIEVQPEGRPRRSGLDWANGARLGPGDKLGD